jgi:hypothetical protein
MDSDLIEQNKRFAREIFKRIQKKPSSVYVEILNGNVEVGYHNGNLPPDQIFYQEKSFASQLKEILARYKVIVDA